MCKVCAAHARYDYLIHSFGQSRFHVSTGWWECANQAGSRLWLLLYQIGVPLHNCTKLRNMQHPIPWFGHIVGSLIMEFKTFLVWTMVIRLWYTIEILWIRKQDTTPNATEGLWLHFRKFIRGRSAQHTSPELLPPYTDEFMRRLNHEEENPNATIRHMLRPHDCLLWISIN